MESKTELKDFVKKNPWKYEVSSLNLSNFYLLSELCLLFRKYNHQIYALNIEEFIFHLGSGSCPECEAPLRRVNFKLQLFEDASIDKEVTIRRQVLRDFCQTQDDFETLREWNDYLEQVEDIIFNLVNNIDKEETERTIAKYKESNKQFIKKNQYVDQIYLIYFLCQLVSSYVPYFCQKIYNFLLSVFIS